MALLNQFIPVGLAVKGLEKIDPRMKSFIGAAGAFGYGANEIISYLRSKTHTASQKANRANLEESVARGTARPDEAANLERLNQSEIPGDILQGAGALGAGALGGLGASGALSAAQQAVAPGVQAAASRVGKVASQPIAHQGAKNTIPAQSLGSRAAQGAPAAPDVFLRKHPELGRFLENRINQGIDPMTASKQAKTVKALQPKIRDIEQSMGQPLESLVSQVFGGGQAQGRQAPSQAQSALLEAINQTKSLLGGR